MQREEKKTEMVKMYFLKLLLTDFVEHRKVFCGSWPTFYQMDFMKGNDMLLKVEKIYSLLRNVIGKQIKEEGHDRNN